MDRGEVGLSHQTQWNFFNAKMFHSGPRMETDMGLGREIALWLPGVPRRKVCTVYPRSGLYFPRRVAMAVAPERSGRPRLLSAEVPRRHLVKKERT